MSLKLGPIPDRKPVKLSLSLAPDVHAALIDYAAIHAREYGSDVGPRDVASLIVERFLGRDSQFKRMRKSLHHSTSAKE
jgi:hypothetical protein